VFTGQRALKSFGLYRWGVYVVLADFHGLAVAFGTWSGSTLRNLIVPLVQIIMFGMGPRSVADFVPFFMPWPVSLGNLHYTVISNWLHDCHLSAFRGSGGGVILIGSVSSAKRQPDGYW